jgi:alpha-L-fucosidase
MRWLLRVCSELLEVNVRVWKTVNARRTLLLYCDDLNQTWRPGNRVIRMRYSRSKVSTAALLIALAFSDRPTRVEAQSTKSSSSNIQYSSLQHLQPGDSEQVIIAKAAHVLPRSNQTEWVRMERTFFIHFGPNTFRHVEWGTGREDPSVFRPSKLSAEQWVQSVKDGGGTMIILVCKHHDGLALWPSRYTTHSIAGSTWRGGHGNLVREVAEAARKYHIKLGVYLSPADLYQLRTNPINPQGYYGDESAPAASIIPTNPVTFKTDPAKGRQPAPGFGSFHYQVDDYNRYFLNQLYELLTEYGPIQEVWFDGANPDSSVKEIYDYNAWYDMIRHLQPKAIIFGKGPDGRWVGNESGVGRTTEWDPIPLPQTPEQFRWPDMTEKDLGSRDKLTPGSYLWWYPAETNVPILHGWFWAPDKPVRTAAELVDIYYQSVGRNSNWLLNLSPDDRGLIPDLQRANLRLMNQIVTKTFSRDLTAGAAVAADSSAKGHGPSLVLDNNLDTWWEPNEGEFTPTLSLTLPRSVTFDVISLQEAVDHRGQRVESFSVEAWQHSSWQTIAQGTTIGHKRLLRLSTPVSANRIRIHITGSRMEPSLAQVGLFKQAAYTAPPTISDRDSAGEVKLTSPAGERIHYTLDGSVPTLQSAVYSGPLSLVQGGSVEAAVIGADGKLGMIAAKNFPGQAPLGWKITDVDSAESEAPALAAIDGKAETVWTSGGTGSQHHITVDMGSARRIAGFTYLPRQDGLAYGLVKQYKFETSTDGSTWTTQIPSGELANLRNNPELVKVPFAPVDARYFRFTVLASYDDSKAASAAELSVVPAKE